jgi:multidrug efflux pump subunit AcrA (membrane-fusion protein)
MSGEDSNHNVMVQSVSKIESDPLDSEDLNEEVPKSRFRRFLVPGIIGLLLLGGLGWILFTRVVAPLLAFSQMKFHPTPVPLSNPTRAGVENSSDYAATLDSRQSVTLQPRVPGQISAIYVKPGDRVQAGTTILQIDAGAQNAQVASRQAAVETAAANVEAARADVANQEDNLRAQQARRAAAASNVELAQREYERYVNLLQEGATTRQLTDQKLNALQTAQAALRQVDADIRAQQAAVSRAKATVTSNQRSLQQSQANVTEGTAQLQYYTIKAPFDGIVGDIPVKEGDYVSPTTQLLTITQNRQLEVQIQVPLDRASELRIGLPVRLLDDQNKVLKTGRISFVAPNVDASTQSIQVKAVFDNAAGLRTSQFVRTRIVWSTRPGVLVPTTAINRLGGRNFIFVATPFKNSGCEAPVSSGFGPPPKAEPDTLVATQKQVNLGKIVGNDQEVLEGLTENDRIITGGILQLQNCTPIAEAPTATKSP